MDPQQTPSPATSGGYPPQTPTPAPSYDAPAQPPQYQPPAQPASPQYQPPQPNPASWYTPAPKPDANKPGDVNSYLQSAASAQQQSGNTVPGQMVGDQYSIDYLNQLSGSGKQSVDKRFIFVGIGAAIALIFSAFLIFSTPKTTSTANEVKLYTTMVTVTENTKQSKRLIKSSQLSAINGSIQTLLVNAMRDMETPLENMGQDPSSLKTAAKSGSYQDKKLASTLEDARLNGIYDRVYANEMYTKVQYMLVYMESIKKNNSRKSMQEFLSKNESSFKTIKKSFEDFQESDEASLY